MEILMLLLILLIIGVLPAVLIWSLCKNGTKGTFGKPLRYRDGATTYEQFRGARSHIALDLSGTSQRYQRRHPPKQGKRTKAWWIK